MLIVASGPEKLFVTLPEPRLALRKKQAASGDMGHIVKRLTNWKLLREFTTSVKQKVREQLSRLVSGSEVGLAEHETRKRTKLVDCLQVKRYNASRTG